MSTVEIDRTSHSYLLGKTEAKLQAARAALERAQKFIRLGNHPNAGDLLDQISRALEDAQG